MSCARQTERLGLPVKSSELPRGLTKIRVASTSQNSLKAAWRAHKWKETRHERPCDDPYFHFRSWIYGIGMRRRGRAALAGDEGADVGEYHLPEN